MTPVPTTAPGNPIIGAHPGTPWATAAFVLGAVFAAVSAYWGLGGTAMLRTIGGELERAGRSGSRGLLALVWGTVVLKLVAALLPVAVVRGWFSGIARRLTGIAAAAVAAILTVYGAALTVGGLLVVADVIHADPTANSHAIRWHAFFWDPWFLVWGVCAGAALLQSRRGHREGSLRNRTTVRSIG